MHASVTLFMADFHLLIEWAAAPNVADAVTNDTITVAAKRAPSCQLTPRVSFTAV
jgi:hypothetical protein